MPYWVYFCNVVIGMWENRRSGVIESEELHNATGCVLTFKYTAQSYFNRFQIDVIPGGMDEWTGTYLLLVCTLPKDFGRLNIGQLISN